MVYIFYDGFGVVPADMFLPTSNSSNLVFVYLVSVFDGHWRVCLSGKMAGYPVLAGYSHCSAVYWLSPSCWVAVE